MRGRWNGIFEGKKESCINMEILRSYDILFGIEQYSEREFALTTCLSWVRNLRIAGKFFRGTSLTVTLPYTHFTLLGTSVTTGAILNCSNDLAS